jgi:hypothetical protein
MAKTHRGSRRYYERLKSPASSIRLLTLGPLRHTDLIDCTLKSYDLDSCPPYVALSYEWGDVEPQVEVTINGVSSRIRHNLSLFLGVLQTKMKRKTLSHDLCLWIDAICIDQEDLSERNAQVTIMGQIYQKAASVFAWLGWPQGWDPILTFDFIERAPKALDDKRDSEVLSMVLQMCGCRYWSRRWIVQEVLLAENVTIMCGENDLSWSALSLFSIRYSYSPTRQKLYCAMGLDRTIPFIMTRHTHSVSTIRQLMVDFCGMDCEVIHDKVYSLLSLASDGGMIPVDYGCLPEELLYRVLTRSDWSQNEVQLLAGELGIPTLVPNRFRPFEKVKVCEQSAVLAIEERFAVTHQIRLCTMPLSLTEREWENWRACIEAESTKPCQELTDLPDFCKTVAPYEPYRPGANCRCGNYGKRYSRSKCPERCRQFNNLGPRFITCNDGTVGLACASARAGDLLCDFIPGRKIVVREDHDNTPCLVGTATLPGAFSTFADFTLKVRQVLELALQEQNYHDFLQLDCSNDGSTVADGLLKIERSIMSSRIQALSNFVSLSEADQTKLTCRERPFSFPKQAIKGSYNMWDLIALAIRRDKLISIEESDF